MCDVSPVTLNFFHRVTFSVNTSTEILLFWVVLDYLIMDMIRTIVCTVIMLTIMLTHCARADPQLVFYKFFTPIKLASAATFIHHHNSITSRLLTFLSAPSAYYRLMIVPLIPPGVIDTNAKLVVKMAVGVETTFGRADSDPSFGVSDGHRFIGVFTDDKTNYNNHAPCFGYEGASGTSLTNTFRDPGFPKPSESQYYPGRFEIQLSLTDRWGTCFVPLDGGFSREMVYQYKLNPHNGLFLEIYGNDAKEKEGIKYIEMTILQEN